ncbi:MAG: polysaccharide export protein, partial [Chthonomonadales bacterium]|nr:polysaccharide export protein [Chthonomonadales bacterium]
MKYFHPLCIAAVLCLMPATLFAQAKQVPQPPPIVAGSPAEILAPDDVIIIQIGNHDDLDQTTIIGQDGKITLREFGQFVAAGKTRAALQNEIQIKADKTLNNAPVFITMKERHAERITVDGGVTSPGVYQYQSGMRVLDAISAAHGLPLRPNRYTLKLLRNERGQTLNVAKIYTDPDTEANPKLMPNDKLVFNEVDVIRRKVTVLGQVNQPSTYIVDGDTTVLILIREAGGLLPAAALTKVEVTRNGTKIPLNLRPILVKANVDQPVLDFRFEDGDVLSIPGVETKYQVLGQVNRPSSYVFPEEAKITVLDALQAAGGQTQVAD